MLGFLKNHPFAVEAYFKSSLVLTFAVPKEELKNMIPECLELDTFENKWAFIAVAMVQTQHLRPKGVPQFLGNDFFLIGYRIFVKYTSSKGKKYRGLYIIKSEINKRKMAFFGNIFTHYNYTTTNILQKKDVEKITISSVQSDFKIQVSNNENEIVFPDGSPFTNWKDARKFAGPLPFTFTYNEAKKEVLIIQGIRQNWNPKPVEVLDYKFAYLNRLNCQGIVLASAFQIKDIPYQWTKGKIDKWKS